MQEVATGALRAIGEGLVGLAVKGFGMLSDAVTDGIADARHNAEIQAQTAAVLKSTGEAAGVSADHIADYASALSDAAGKSLFGDDQIQQSTNLLLTFTNIKGATLDAATAISVDMAQAMGGAPKDAAIQLGKALNDPVKGITALSRVGVTFTDEQKAQIQAMQEAGDTAGAQAVILGELNKEFGGSAEAAATATGGWSEFNGRMGEAKEALGAAVLPLLTQLAGVLNDTILPIIEGAASAFGDLVATFQEVGPMSDEFGESFGYVLEQLGFADPIVQAVENGIFGLQALFADTSPMDTFSAATAALSAFWTDTLQPAFAEVWRVLTTQVWPILSDLGTALFPLVGAAIQILAGFWNDVLAPALRNAWTILTTVILPILASVAGWLKDNLPGAIQATADFLTDTLFPALHKAYDFINANVIPILVSVKDWLLTNVPTAIQKTTDFFNDTLLPAINAIWTFFKDNIIPILTTAVNWLKVEVPIAIQALTDAWNNVLLPAITTIWTFFKDNIIPIIEKLANVVIAGLKAEVSALAALWKDVLLPAITAVWKFITDPLIPIIKDLIDIHFAAFKSAFDAISKAWNETLKPAFEAIYNYLYNTLGPQMATFNSNVLTPMEEAWGNIRDAVGWLIDKLHDLADLWESMKPPDWVTGHSPPPMANWFTDISDAVGAVNAQLPTLQMNLAAQLGPAGQSVTNTASSRSFTYAPQISTTGNVSAPMDLALANSLASV